MPRTFVELKPRFEDQKIYIDPEAVIGVTSIKESPSYKTVIILQGGDEILTSSSPEETLKLLGHTARAYIPPAPPSEVKVRPVSTKKVVKKKGRR